VLRVIHDHKLPEAVIFLFADGMEHCRQAAYIYHVNYSVMCMMSWQSVMRCPDVFCVTQRWVKDKRVSANVWTDVPRMQTRTGGDYVVRLLASCSMCIPASQNDFDTSSGGRKRSLTKFLLQIWPVLHTALVDAGLKSISADEVSICKALQDLQACACLSFTQS
jgi:hypothetical protein